MLKIAHLSNQDLAFDIALDQIDVDRYLPPRGIAKANEGRPSVRQKGSAPKAVQTSEPARKPLNLAMVVVDGRLKAGNVTLNIRRIQDIQLSLAGRKGPIKMELSARLEEGRCP